MSKCGAALIREALFGHRLGQPVQRGEIDTAGQQGQFQDGLVGLGQAATLAVLQSRSRRVVGRLVGQRAQRGSSGIDGCSTQPLLQNAFWKRAFGGQSQLLVIELGTADLVDDHRAQRQTGSAKFGKPVERFLHRHLLQQGDQVHGGARRTDDAHHRVSLGADRSDLREPGDLGVHVEEPCDPASRRSVQDHRVIGRTAHLLPALDRFGSLPGQQDITQSWGDGGREVDGPQPAQGVSAALDAVEHLEVFQHRRLGVNGQRVNDAAVLGHGHLALLVGQRGGVEDLSNTLAAFHLEQ